MTVAKSGSFTAASHALHVSQPALGLQVKQLEDGLGIRLLDRHSRGVTLTKAGGIFYEHATEILDWLERAEASLLPFKNDQKTNVLFGVTPSTARTIVPELLEACARTASPSIRIVVQQGHSAEMLEEVEAKSLDMAFCYDVSKSDRLGALPLYGEDLSFSSVHATSSETTATWRSATCRVSIDHVWNTAWRARLRRGDGSSLRGRTEHPP